MSILYSKEHLWARPSDDGRYALIGISRFASDQMAGIVYADLGDAGRDVEKGDELGIVESTKAVESLVCPFACRVVAVNDISGTELNDNPEEREKWLYKVDMKDADWSNDLMDETAYRKYVEDGHEDS